MAASGSTQSMPSPHILSRGFTLVEVLVALAIAAIALSAIARAVIHATDTTTVLRERQTALWVAQNQLTKTRLAGIWPAANTTKGTVTLAGREWQWEQRVIATAEVKLRRIEVDVTLRGDDTNSAHLFGFVRHPARVQ